tara:strand:+ start:1452 stop:2429 length:978 start_codon:yes stop_codon:yes gene_type:complete
MAYAGMGGIGGGPDSGHPGGGTSPGNVSGGVAEGTGASGPPGRGYGGNADPDVEAAIEGALGSNFGHSLGGAISKSTGKSTQSAKEAGTPPRETFAWDFGLYTGAQAMPSNHPSRDSRIGRIGRNPFSGEQDLSSTLGTPVVETETPVVETETPLEKEMRFDFKNFYSALDDDDATEEAKALEIQGFLDHISRKNYTDTGFLSQLGFRSPQLNQRQQIAQIENFLDKHQASIDALNKAYSKRVNENPGFRYAMPGYALTTGLMGLIGLEPQHVHPAVQDLYDMMAALGMIEKETPEMTDAKKIAQCNATEGYRWDWSKHACVKIT